MAKHQFGGEWTADKLERVRKYLQAYTMIFRRNPSHTPIYLLCFAAGNPKGAKTAVKIAQDILRP